MKTILETLKRKWAEYLLEIAVIVVGILVALMLNTWNDHRKQKNIETSYLERIGIDLRSDTEYLDRRTTLSNKEIERFKNYVHASYKQQANVSEYRELISSINWSAENLILQDITIQEMINSGTMDLIRSPVLKTSILTYYKLYSTSAAHIAEMNQTSLDMITHLSSSIFVLKFHAKDVFENDQIMENIDWEFINEPGSAKFQEFENVVGYYTMKQQAFLIHFENLQNANTQLIREIEDELGD